jgi:hypothetical protein
MLCFSVESKLPETPQVEERIIIGGENEGFRTQSPHSRLEPEVLHKFHGKSREVGYCVYNTTSLQHEATEVTSSIIKSVLNS